jgi:hypothetical protein
MNEQVPPTLSNRGSARAKIAIVIGVLILATIALLMLARAPTTNRDYGRMLQCASNLKSISIAIEGFAYDHGGKMPERLEDLSQYHSSDNIFFCPSAKDNAHYSYALTGVTNIWGASSNIVIVIEVDPNHYGKRYVLYGDGRVELRADSQL